MAKGKVSGFLLAVVLAVISFLVIFFLFPDTADRYFGVSIKHNAEEVRALMTDVRDQVKSSTETIVDKAIGNVVDSSQDFINNVISGTVEKVNAAAGSTDYSELINR